MREYDFVSIPIERRRDGDVLKSDHREVIRQRAAAGWTFVQAIAFEWHARPHLELVFSRKATS